MVDSIVQRNLVNANAIEDEKLLNYLKNWQYQPGNKAVSFPSFMYTSKEVYRLEKEQFFGRCWLYVGHTSQLEPGSYFTVDIADIPLLIVKDSQGKLRAFHNVCPHRAAPVATGSGSCSRFVCPYHAWTFDLEGRLKSVRDFEEYEDFDFSKHGLLPVNIDTWGPFIFINLDRNCPSLKTQLNELPGLFDDYKFSEWSQAHSCEYHTNANWKLYIENTCESYHLPIVHQSSYGTNETSWNNNNKLVRSEARHHYYLEYNTIPPEGNELVQEFKAGTAMAGLPPRLMQSYLVTAFWPNFALICNPNLIVVYLVDPQGVSQTRIRWEWLVPNTPEAKSPENLDPLIEIYDRVQHEDLKFLPEVQKRIESPGYVLGPLSPTREVGVHRFQELLMEYLTGLR